jgi:hypothetical protein
MITSPTGNHKSKVLLKIFLLVIIAVFASFLSVMEVNAQGNWCDAPGDPSNIPDSCVNLGNPCGVYPPTACGADGVLTRCFDGTWHACGECCDENPVCGSGMCIRRYSSESGCNNVCSTGPCVNCGTTPGLPWCCPNPNPPPPNPTSPPAPPGGTPPPGTIPTPGPCRGPAWITAYYICNSDGTAQVTWDWEDVDQANTYFLEFDDAMPPPFQVSDIHYNTWFLARMTNPENPRTSRVRVWSWDPGSVCSGPSDWSPVVITSNSCPSESTVTPGGVLSSLLFCDQNGNPTNDPSLTGNIYTAIGCIPARNLQAFAAFILSWSVGIAGGITLILFSFASYLYITSAGNPKKIQAARELILAAVSGILLLIFSVFLLRLIGVDILRIPGF